MTPIIPVTAGALGAPLLGAVGAALFGRPVKGAPAGLLFHSLDVAAGFSLSTLSTIRFRKIIGHLAGNGFSSLTLEQSAVSGRSPGKRPVHLTFDDGCRSFITNALPVLEQYHYKAVLFPVAGYLGKTSSWDVLPQFTHLSAREIREISALGHEIGSHGLTHSNLTWLKTSDLKNELFESKKILEDITGKSVTSLSFPFGSWDRRVWECAQEAGYLRGAIYRRHRAIQPNLVPVYGVYRFDSPEFIMNRIAPRYLLSLSTACARIMSHFAKGAPMWKFSKEYRL